MPQPPDMFAAMEQHAAWCGQWAHSLSNMYLTLVNDGVDRRAATSMVIAYEEATIDQTAALNAVTSYVQDMIDRSLKDRPQ